MFRAYRTGFVLSTNCKQAFKRKSTTHIRMATSSPTAARYMLLFYVPIENTDQVVAAVHQTGAGTYPGGIYGECAFITRGTGTFRPLDGANPAIGNVGTVEKVEENKVEILCMGKDCMQQAVKALKEAHPYEQVAYFVFKAEEE